MLAAALKGVDLLPAGFTVEDSSLSSLAKTDYSTVLIALAAGIAAMLSFETRASAAVGVAISVTTIPASAYLGVALGAGGAGEALGALVVLLVNVSLLILSGSTTLVVQRWPDPALRHQRLAAAATTAPAPGGARRRSRRCR